MNCIFKQIVRILLLFPIWLLCSLSTYAQGQEYALVMGIKGYPQFDMNSRLQFADEDAKQFAEFIQSKEGGGFPKDNVHILLNEKATRANISLEILKLSQKVHGDDLFYLFFAGHGINDETTNIAYLMPYDGNPADPEGAGFRADDLIERIRTKISAKHILFFIDACYAGAALNQGSSRGDENIIPVLRESWSKKLEGQRNAVHMGIMSANSRQKSWEDELLKHGLFTYYLLEGLKGKANTVPADDTITAGELYKYIYDNVTKLSQDKYQLQTPIVSPTFETTFPLAEYKKLTSITITKKNEYLVKLNLGDKSTELAKILRDKGYLVEVINDEPNTKKEDLSVIWIGRLVAPAIASELIRSAKEKMPWLKYVFIQYRRIDWASHVLINAHKAWVEELGLIPLNASDFDKIANPQLTIEEFHKLLEYYKR